VEGTISLRCLGCTASTIILYKEGRFMIDKILAVATALVAFSLGCLIGYFTM